MGDSAGETRDPHAHEVSEWLVWIAVFLFLIHLMCGIWVFYMAMCAPIWTMGPEYDPMMANGKVLK
jgi:hypothetical protein